MQKKLIVLAIAGFAAAPAYAQWTMMNVQSPTPGVNIFGILDQALESGNWGSGSASRLTGSGYSTQRFGVRGNEDIGGGVRANFWLEASLGPDTGTGGAGVTASSFQQWDRAATVGLSFPDTGAFNVGRQYTPWFSAWARSDAFRVAGIGSSYTTLLFQNTRMNNSLRWDSPNWGGFQVILGGAIGDQGAAVGYTESVGGAAPANQKNSGRQTGGAVVFDQGPWQAAFGYSKDDSVVAVPASPVVRTQWSLNGAYNFGVAKVLLGYTHLNNDTNPKSVDRNIWSLQASFPFGPHAIIAGYQGMSNKALGCSDCNARQFGLQYAYSMSKRTTLYATYAKMNNDTNQANTLLSGAGLTNNAGAGFDPSAIQMGINHTF
jgi:predicted porin